MGLKIVYCISDDWPSPKEYLKILRNLDFGKCISVTTDISFARRVTCLP